MGAIIERPESSTVRRHEERERVAWVVDRDLTIHVGAGQIEHHEGRMHGRIGAERHAMKCDPVKRRRSATRLEYPLEDVRRAFELMRRTGGRKRLLTVLRGARRR